MGIPPNPSLQTDNKMSMKLIALLFAFVAVAHAENCNSYTYDLANFPTQAGKLVNNYGLSAFKLTFSEGNGPNPARFDLDITINTTKTLSSNWWLVVSDSVGGNPKGEIGEYIIFYGCQFSSFASMYVYNGENSVNSYKKAATTYGPPIHLGTVAMTVTQNGPLTRYQFSLNHDQVHQLGLQQLTIRQNDGYDVTNLDRWDGASFDDNIGVWFHTSGNVNGNPSDQCAFNAEGEVTKFATSGNFWLDFANKPTIQTQSPCGTPPPGGGPPSPPEVCEAKASGCCDECSDQCAMPAPAGSGGMACMETEDGLKCSYSSNKKRLYFSGSSVNGGD